MVGAAGASVNRGHSDNSPANALAASTDNDACFGTGQTCSLSSWDTQRRNHKLSTGELIWDLGGNVMEWVSDNNTTNQGTDNKVSILTSPTYDLLKWGPTNNYSSTHTSGEYAGLGHGFLSSNAGTVVRGGHWGSGVGSGLFSSFLSYGPSGVGGNFGFRCVWLPQ